MEETKKVEEVIVEAGKKGISKKVWIGLGALALLVTGGIAAYRKGKNDGEITITSVQTTTESVSEPSVTE